MYTNKPGAVIRELACNAFDAHVEKGNPEVPFEIHLPTWLDKTFMIRDYGIGIPHDKFELIYTTIGESTKDATNDLTGMFGLGSKVSFSMVDSFTVENWRDGEKSTWLCFKNAGNPQVTMLNKEASDEPSGVKVSFVFEEDEVDEFTRQLTKQLKYFPTKPIITGGEGVAEWDELPDGWETKDYFYSKQRGVYSWSRTHYVVMGNVAYDLNESEVLAPSGVFHESLTIKVPIGSVDIPPSRETLEYTAKTKTYLNAVLARIKKDYQQKFDDEVSKITDYLELRKKVYNSNGHMVNKGAIKFKGVEYTRHHLSRSHLSGTEHGLTVKHIQNRYTNVYRSTVISMVHVVNGLTLYINDLGVGASTHINNEYSKITSDCYIIEPLKGTKKTRQSLLDAEIKRTKDFFGKEPKLLSSIIGFPVKTSASARAKPDQIFKITKSAGTTRNMVISVADIPTKGYMLPMYGWDVEGIFKGKLQELGQFVDEIDAPVYLVRKNTRKDVNLKSEEDLQKHLNTLLTPRVIAHQKAIDIKDKFSLRDMNNLKTQEWKEVDAILYLLIGYYERRVTRRVSVCNYNDAVTLLSNIPKSSAFISTRAQKLLDSYKEKYAGLVSALGSGWNHKSNFEQLHNFLKHNGQKT
jgi:hypothetical protein